MKSSDAVRTAMVALMMIDAAAAHAAEARSDASREAEAHVAAQPTAQVPAQVTTTPSAGDNPLQQAPPTTVVSVDPAKRPSFIADDGSLTVHGITLYGTVDIGVTYQTHGTPISDVAG